RHRLTQSLQLLLVEALRHEVSAGYEQQMSVGVLSAGICAHQLYRLGGIERAQPDIHSSPALVTTGKLEKNEMFSIRQERRPAFRYQAQIGFDLRNCRSGAS